MRLAFCGYQNIGFASLASLIELSRQHGDDIVAVITHADDPGEEIWFPSVRDLAFRSYLPVYQPDDPNDPAFVAVLRRLAPDFLVSCYYRYMLTKPLLEVPTRGAVNLHGSLLPRYRGRCPVNWVLVHGETETGLTLHDMEEKPDRGAILAQARIAIEPQDTALIVNEKLAAAAGPLWRDIYPLWRTGRAPRTPQDHRQASYFGGRRPEDGRIDWHRPAQDIFNLIRAVTHPYPGAFTTWRGDQLFIWWGLPEANPALPPLPPGAVHVEADSGAVYLGTGAGVLRLLRAQFAGAPEVDGPGLTSAFQGLAGQTLGN